MKTMRIWIHSLIAALLLACIGEAAETNRPTCAVLGFEAGGGLTAEDAQFIHARYAALLPKYDQYDVIAESRIQDMLKVAEFNRSDFTSTMDYALEIGKILQIRYVIIGSVGRIGDLYSLNTSVVDVETGRIVDTAVTDLRGTLTEFAQKAAEKNIQELLYGSQTPPGPSGTAATSLEGGAPDRSGTTPATTATPSRRPELEQARRLFASGLYKEAAEAAKKAMDESGPSVEGHILLGEAYAKQKGWYNLAARELEKAIALDPTTIDGRLALARIHIECGGRGDKAKELLDEVRAMSPEQPGLEDLSRQATRLMKP